jgi:ketosteroid isomerase-like protein
MTGKPVADDVRGYIDAIPAGHRPLFDRLHRLILASGGDVTVVLAYKMPTYRAGGGRRVHLGAWKHGVSVYGWRKDDDGGFVARHPALKTSTGTLRLRPEDAAAISDEEFLGLFSGALGG